MDARQRQQEEERLVVVSSLIRDRIQDIKQDIDETRTRTTEIAANLWEEGHHLIYDFDDVVEYQQYTTDLAFHDRWTQHNRLQLAALRKLLDSPYFGRIDFTASGQGKTSEIYIGIHSLNAPGQFRPLVHDWRSPICSMFYDHGVGEASYLSPSGEIRGTIRLKRQYRIRNGAFEYLLDSDLKIDDEILQRELSQRSESRLRTIVGSIQREQNAAIRSGTGENLLVFGAAGSGKTSIGLHRLAWHLYQARGHIASNNILIFAQSNVFHSYIADIIPELGEEDVRRLSFGQMIREQFAQGWSLQDACELTEHFIAARGGDGRVAGVGVKYAADFLDFLDFLARRVAGLRFAFDDIRVFQRTILSGGQLAERFDADSRHRPYVRLRRLSEYVGDRIEDYFVRKADEIKVRLLEQMVDAKDVDEAYGRLLQSTRDKARHSLQARVDLDATRLYRDALREYAHGRGLDEEDEGIYGATAARLDAGELPFEDALALLYLRLLTGELEPLRSIRHVLIDEAQDFCALQHRIIRELTPDSKYTVLADMAQAMVPALNLHSREQLRALYGGRVMALTRSYRSTRQIYDLAAALLDKPRGETFDRQGPRPRLLTCDDAAAAVLRLLDLPPCRGASVGVITKTLAQAKALHKRLNRKDIGLLDNSESAFRPGAQVLPVALAKGLEFDCVILPDCSADALRTPQDKRILYLMCTRALHHLFLLCPGELTGFLGEHGDLMEGMSL